MLIEVNKGLFKLIDVNWGQGLVDYSVNGCYLCILI